MACRRLLYCQSRTSIQLLLLLHSQSVMLNKYRLCRFVGPPSIEVQVLKAATLCPRFLPLYQLRWNAVLDGLPRHAVKMFCRLVLSQPKYVCAHKDIFISYLTHYNGFPGYRIITHGNFFLDVFLFLPMNLLFSKPVKGTLACIGSTTV